MTTPTVHKALQARILAYALAVGCTTMPSIRQARYFLKCATVLVHDSFAAASL